MFRKSFGCQHGFFLNVYRKAILLTLNLRQIDAVLAQPL